MLRPLSISRRWPKLPTAHTELVQAVLEAVSLVYKRSACVQKINTMAALAGDRYVASALPGTADILGTIRGMPVAIECKTPTDRQRKQQKLFEAAWRRAGGTYILARSMDQALVEIGRALVDRLGIGP